MVGKAQDRKLNLSHVNHSLTRGDQRPSPFTFWSLVPPFLRCNNPSVRTSALRSAPPSERTTFPTMPRAAPGMLSAASSSFSSGLPTTPTRPHGPGSPWPGLGWRRRRRRGSYGGGGLCREVRQRRRGESRVLWSELEGEAGGVRGWAVSARGRGPARVVAWGEGPSLVRPGREAGAAGGRGGRGGSLDRGGWGWLGSGTQGTRPSSPASLSPPMPGPAVPQAQGDRGRRSFQSPAFKVTREHQDGRDFWKSNHKPQLLSYYCWLLQSPRSFQSHFHFPNSAPQFVSLLSGAYVRGSVRSRYTYTWRGLTQRDPPWVVLPRPFTTAVEPCPRLGSVQILPNSPFYLRVGII